MRRRLLHPVRRQFSPVAFSSRARRAETHRHIEEWQADHEC